jgi:short-subunit dehydrogenase
MLKSDVHVMTACPGFTTSNIRKRSLTKDGASQGDSPRDEARMMSAEECARHIYAATVRRKKILILTAQGKFTVFLNKWFPGLTDRLVYNVMAKEQNSPLK